MCALVGGPRINYQQIQRLFLSQRFFENLQQLNHFLQARVQLQSQQNHAQRSVVLCQITSMPEVASALLPSYETATEHSSSNSNRDTGSLAQRVLQRTLDITEVASSYDVVDASRRRATRRPRESMSWNELAQRLQHRIWWQGPR